MCKKIQKTIINIKRLNLFLINEEKCNSEARKGEIREKIYLPQSITTTSQFPPSSCHFSLSVSLLILLITLVENNEPVTLEKIYLLLSYQYNQHITCI